MTRGLVSKATTVVPWAVMEPLVKRRLRQLAVEQIVFGTGRKGRRAVVYCRISDDTEGKGLGVKRQEKICRELAERWKLDIVFIFVDNDISASKGKRRPMYLAMLDAMARGEFEYLLAYAPDRITRHPTELEHLISVLDDNEIQVITAQSGIYDLTTPAGRMVARQMGSVAIFESELKRGRVRDKFVELVEAGRPSGGVAPYGYSRVEKQYIIDDEEAEVLKTMAACVLDGMSLAETARELNKSERHARQGGPWPASRVRQVLINPSVAGLRSHRPVKKDGSRGDTVTIVGKGEWDPIFKRGEWEQVCKTLTDPARKRKRPVRSYPLTGVLLSHDDRAMHGQFECKRKNGGPDRRTYRTFYGKGVRAVMVDADLTEQLVFEAALQRIERIDFSAVSSPGDGDSSEALGALIEELEVEQEELAVARGERKITLKQFLIANEGLQKQIDEAKGQMPVAARRLPAGLDDPSELRRRWDLPEEAEDHIPDDRKRDIVQAVIPWVKVNPGTPGRVTTEQERLDATARRLELAPLPAALRP